MREIRKNFGDPDREEWAPRLGVSKNTLASYERGETEPTASVLAAYREQFGISPLWIVSAVGDPYEDPSKMPRPALQVDARMLEEMHSTIERMAEVTLGTSSRFSQPVAEAPRAPTVRYYAVPASAGAGYSAIHEAPAQELDIDEFCDLAFNTSAKYITMHHVRGDSMLPTLPNGAVAVIDRRVRGEPDDGVVYLVSFDGDVLLKRIDYQEDGSIHLRSDNDLPEYVPIRVPSDRKSELKIFGRLIGVIHTVK